jgi:ATP-binding cassette subfamily C protein LapB
VTSMEPGNTGVDPRLSFDDPLLDGLLILCKLHGATVSRASLSAGLPMAHQRLSLDLLPRAAARAGLQARLLRRDLKDISPLNLPVMLLLNNGRTAVLRRIGDDGRVLILPSEADGGEQWLTPEELAEHYSGQALFARPRHELEDLRSPLVPRVQAWVRATQKLSQWLYSAASRASFLPNRLGRRVPRFV